MMRAIGAGWLLLLTAGSASAQATLDVNGVAAAANPVIARCLVDVRALDAALVATPPVDVAAFFAPEYQVNGPNNSVGDKRQLLELRGRGWIQYDRYVRKVEHAELRPNGEILLMGLETVDPRGQHPLAGQRVERRFTDIWRTENGRCVTSVRQATIYKSTPLPK